MAAESVTDYINTGEEFGIRCPLLSLPRLFFAHSERASVLRQYIEHHTVAVFGFRVIGPGSLARSGFA